MLKNKTQEFKKAMDIYYNNIFYNKFGIIVSVSIITMQLILLCNFSVYFDKGYNIISITILSIVLIIAYIFTDFINGFIHMYMDNNTNYKSIIGPFIAAFHMHHKQQRYKQRNPIFVYFMESGSKFWLVIYLGILICLQSKIYLFVYLNLFLITIGIFSSFAEVSHYWCHNSDKNNFVISKLQKLMILLPKKHHQEHHVNDNMNYAFLNGVTDPILNIIAKYLYTGYKNRSDLHALAYDGKQTDNR